MRRAKRACSLRCVELLMITTGGAVSALTLSTSLSSSAVVSWGPSAFFTSSSPLAGSTTLSPSFASFGLATCGFSGLFCVCSGCTWGFEDAGWPFRAASNSAEPEAGFEQNWSAKLRKIARRSGSVNPFCKAVKAARRWSRLIWSDRSASKWEAEGPNLS